MFTIECLSELNAVGSGSRALLRWFQVVVGFASIEHGGVDCPKGFFHTMRLMSSSKRRDLLTVTSCCNPSKQNQIYGLLTVSPMDATNAGRTLLVLPRRWKVSPIIGRRSPHAYLRDTKQER
jgi:hypothetical protein